MDYERYKEIKAAKNNSNKATDGYRFVMMPDFNLNDDVEEDEVIEFDTIMGVSSNSASNITQYPLVNGDIVADHMTRQPITLTISGTFSLIGNKPTLFTGDSNDRLTNIETYFENIKNRGTLSTIVMRSRKNNIERFTRKRGMALTDIRWNYSQISLGYSFTFKEVLLINVDEFEEPPEEMLIDENIPAITDGESFSFTDEFVDPDQIYLTMLLILIREGIVDSDFLAYYQSNSPLYKEVIQRATGNPMTEGEIYGLSAAIGLGTGVLVGSLVVAFGASGPVGWIAGAVVGVIAGLIALAGLFDRKYKIEEFRLASSDLQNMNEVRRLDNMNSELFREIHILDEASQFFKFPTDGAQECLLYINNNYYVFNTVRNNTTNEWELTVVGADKYEYVNKISMKANALKSLADVSNESHLFRTDGGGWYIYLYIDNLYEIENNTALSETERNTQINECYSKTSNYGIIVSQAILTDFNDKLTQIIENALRR